MKLLLKIFLTKWSLNSFLLLLTIGYNLLIFYMYINRGVMKIKVIKIIILAICIVCLAQGIFLAGFHLEKNHYIDANTGRVKKIVKFYDWVLSEQVTDSEFSAKFREFIDFDQEANWVFNHGTFGLLGRGHSCGSDLHCRFDDFVMFFDENMDMEKSKLYINDFLELTKEGKYYNTQKTNQLVTNILDSPDDSGHIGTTKINIASYATSTYESENIVGPKLFISLFVIIVLVPTFAYAIYLSVFKIRRVSE